MRLFKTPRDLFQQLERAGAGRQILDLGMQSGRKFSGSVGVDIRPGPNVDVLHDLNTFPYPFPDDSFDLIICRHVLEHLRDLDKVLDEIWRIARPGARLVVEVPHFTNVEAFRHWQHVRFFTAGSFDFFGPTNTNYRARFRILRRHIFFNDGLKLLGIEWLANRLTRMYERHFAFWFPAGSIFFELEAVKSIPPEGRAG